MQKNQLQIAKLVCVVIAGLIMTFGSTAIVYALPQSPSGGAGTRGTSQTNELEAWEYRPYRVAVWIAGWLWNHAPSVAP